MRFILNRSCLTKISLSLNVVFGFVYRSVSTHLSLENVHVMARNLVRSCNSAAVSIVTGNLIQEFAQLFLKVVHTDSHPKSTFHSVGKK